MAMRLARRTGRQDITAMPLGLDTPSTFGMVFFVLGPAFLSAKQTMSVEEAAIFTWHIGICAIVLSGLFKFVCAFGSNWIRRAVPRAGLLGSLAAIALVLISFLPLLEVLRHPIVGFVALAIVLTTLVARVRLPGRVPGALGALIVAALIYYLMKETGTLGQVAPESLDPREGLLPYEWLSAFQFKWLGALDETVQYLPIIIPFALATVVGGIDCTESAAAVGDEYNTNHVIGVEAIATLVGGMCGGVIQTTPYIGHPAYKAMGGRAAYTLATALFVGSAGLLGYFGFLYLIIPKAAVFPILIFVGLEITAQSFHATPKRHYPAVVFACIPALAALVMIFMNSLQGQYAVHVEDLNSQIADLRAQSSSDDLDKLKTTGEMLKTISGTPDKKLIGKPLGPLGHQIETMRSLANGFIVISLLWGAALAFIIDHRLWTAATYFAIAAGCSLFGIIHSPFVDGKMFLPWQLDEAMRETPIRYAIAYLSVAVIMIAWGWWLQSRNPADSKIGEDFKS